MACRRDDLGGLLTWHGKKGRGYVTDISKAHEYTREGAQSSWHRDIDQPVSADHVDALAIYRVDMQHIGCESIDGGDCDYVAFKSGRYNGNDVYWYYDLQNGNKDYSNDFSRAKKYSFREVAMIRNAVFMPFEVANLVKRKVFEIKYFNAQTMVQGAGLKIPDDIKKCKRRSARSSGKVRWNCPHCGKISWQLNPYDFDGCLDRSCDGFDQNQRHEF